MPININNYQFKAIVNLAITRIFIIPSLANRKEFSIWKKKATYNLIVINKNLLLSKNRKIDTKTELQQVTV